MAGGREGNGWRIDRGRGMEREDRRREGGGERGEGDRESEGDSEREGTLTSFESPEN